MLGSDIFPDLTVHGWESSDEEPICHAMKRRRTGYILGRLHQYMGFVFFNGFAGSLAHCPHALLVGADLLSPPVASLSRTTSPARVVGHGESNTLTFPYSRGELLLHWEGTGMEREVLVLVAEEPELL